MASVNFIKQGYHIRERERKRERNHERKRRVISLDMPASENEVLVSPVRRNPSWSREELILALELYFRVPPSGVTETHPEIVRVSKELQRLSAHADPADATRFRNPNGVHMKMFNFMALDPSQGGRGLANGGRRDKEVWNEYQDDRSRLNQVAGAIRSAIETKGALEEIFEAPEGEDEDAAEGRVLTRMHRHRERDPAIVRRKKERVLQATGTLRCEACDFDFCLFYGELGVGFIECHHTKPIAFLNPGDRTKMSELALVCANCHRMLHRPKRWLSIPELRTVLFNSNPKAAERSSRGA